MVWACGLGGFLRGVSTLDRGRSVVSIVVEVVGGVSLGMYAGSAHRVVFLLFVVGVAGEAEA